MKALLLCGGFGTRLGRLTKKKPKPLIKIGNKTVIEHIVDRLLGQGIKEIIVKVHYLPDQIMEVLGNRVTYYFEPILYEHFETINNLRPWLEEQSFLVINGDTINDLDYREMINFHEDGYITELVDGWRCAGSWIYPSNYFYQKNKDIKVRPYRVRLNWWDIGTPERLKKAREFYSV